VTYLKILPRYLPGQTEISQRNRKLQLPIRGPIFERWTSRTRSRLAKRCTAMFSPCSWDFSLHYKLTLGMK